MPSTEVQLVILTVILLVLAVILAVVYRFLRRPRKQTEPHPHDLSIDVSQLPTTVPGTEELRLHVYGTPVRVAAVVVAAAGRGAPIPGLTRVPELLESIMPGLGDVVREQQPMVRVWPSQLSSQGFTQSFFNACALPGDRGKGTPWCSVAGKFSVGDRPFLLGLIGYSGRPDSLSQIQIQHEGQWLDVLRISDVSQTPRS